VGGGVASYITAVNKQLFGPFCIFKVGSGLRCGLLIYFYRVNSGCAIIERADVN